VAILLSVAAGLLFQRLLTISPATELGVGALATYRIRVDVPQPSNADADAIGLAVQPDGKLVIARAEADSLVLSRFLPDGTLDATFGTNGSETVRLGWPPFETAVAVQPDGRIVTANFNFIVRRYAADGTIDPTFGDGGHVAASPVRANVRAIAIQSDGRIVVVGQGGLGEPVPTGMVGIAPDTVTALIVRLTPEGSLDLTFGVGGRVSLGFAKGADSANAVLIQPDGSMVMAGSTGFMTAGGFDNDIAVARLDPSGALDASFGVGGTFEAHAPGTAANNGLAVGLDTNGRVIVAGYALRAEAQDAALDLVVIRLNADGALDTTFGDSGFIVQQGVDAHAARVSALPDGRIVVATGKALVRYNQDGSLDGSFGQAGIVEIP
jgi:uncharacterized delta-60 repeat protein